MEIKCSHKNKAYVTIGHPNPDSPVLLIYVSYIQTVCADCGKVLKEVRVNYKEYVESKAKKNNT